jgi:hypothetical protein
MTKIPAVVSDECTAVTEFRRRATKDKGRFPMRIDVFFRNVRTIPVGPIALCCEPADALTRAGARMHQEVMLKVLNRDSELRRIYVLRRWQGLDE